MGVDARGFPGGLLRLDPAFAYAEPPSSGPLPRAECLTLAPGSDRILVELFQILTQYAICRLPAGIPPQWVVLMPDSTSGSASETQTDNPCSSGHLINLGWDLDWAPHLAPWLSLPTPIRCPHAPALPLGWHVH